MAVVRLTCCMLGIFFMILLSSADFFLNYFFFKYLLEMPSECQTFWIQIRHNILLGLIWDQIVCKGYQQKTRAGKEESKIFLTHISRMS